MFSGRQNNEYARVERYERAKKRRIQRDKSPSSTLNEETRENKDDITTLKSKVNQLMKEKEALANELPTLKSNIDDLIKEKEALMNELRSVQAKLEHHQAVCLLTVEAIKEDDVRTKFYTGLSTWYLFTILFNFLSPYVRKPRQLTLMNEFFLVLLKLRLNLHSEDLAFRFGVSLSSVSRIIHKWLDIMYARLNVFIRWPEREVIRKTLPEAFKKHYPKARCIIDCSEIFIERPTSFKAQSQTYSHYKKHNTVKFLIGITPAGVICFLSQCWGGRVSDQELTRNSGFLDKIQPGDVILADRGFLIEDELVLRGASLEIPAFTKGKSQLPQFEVEKSRQLARIRIHVERVIGMLKSRYTLLQSRLPISLLKRDDDEDIGIATIDKLLLVCAVLTNLGEPIV